MEELELQQQFGTLQPMLERRRNLGLLSGERKVINHSRYAVELGLYERNSVSRIPI
jgi:hypothetical protein